MSYSTIGRVNGDGVGAGVPLALSLLGALAAFSGTVLLLRVPNALSGASQTAGITSTVMPTEHSGRATPSAVPKTTAPSTSAPRVAAPSTTVAAAPHTAAAAPKTAAPTTAAPTTAAVAAAPKTAAPATAAPKIAAARPAPARPTLCRFAIHYPSAQAVPIIKDRQQVRSLSRWLLAHKAVKILVRGHADSRGAASFNMRLSVKRSEWISTRFLRAGIPKSRMNVQAFGEHAPLDEIGLAETSSRNRRTEIILRGTRDCPDFQDAKEQP